MTAHMTMKVTRKGQVTIPKPIRDQLEIRAGSKVDFEVADDGRFFSVTPKSLVGGAAGSRVCAVRRRVA